MTRKLHPENTDGAVWEGLEGRTEKKKEKKGRTGTSTGVGLGKREGWGEAN